MLGVAEQLAEIRQLLLQQEARDGGLEEMGDRFGGRMSPMRRPERIVHIEITERREDFRQLGIVLLLARPEARVLDERDTAARQPPRRGDTGRRIGNELDERAEQRLEIAD